MQLVHGSYMNKPLGAGQLRVDVADYDSVGFIFFSRLLKWRLKSYKKEVENQLDKEIAKTAFKMITKICGSKHCSMCPLAAGNHPFSPVSYTNSICFLPKSQYTDEIIQYINDWYNEIIHDGELVLPKQINISAEDILEVFK